MTATNSQQMQCRRFTDALAEIGGGGQVKVGAGGRPSTHIPLGTHWDRSLGVEFVRVATLPYADLETAGVDDVYEGQAGCEHKEGIGR